MGGMDTEADTEAARRDALREQLRYLLVEVDALEPLLGGFPASVLTLALPGERSPLATFAHLAALDREVYASRLERILAEPDPTFDDADPDGTVCPTLEEALEDVRAARRALAAAFDAVADEAWARTATFPDGERRDLAGLALAIVQRDAAELRRLAYRLHETKLTERAVDLPK